MSRHNRPMRRYTNPYREPMPAFTAFYENELHKAAIDAYDKWRDYFDADERADFWKPLVIAMGRLGSIAKGSEPPPR